MSVQSITTNDFDQEVMSAHQKVLLDFWAPWCGPCRAVAPIVEEIAREHGYLKVCKINVDEEPELARRFDIMTIPTLMVMESGVIRNRAAGAMNKSQILALLG